MKREACVDAPSQIALAELDAHRGGELFVIGDGWFHGRDDDTAGLGDWWPDGLREHHAAHPAR